MAKPPTLRTTHSSGGTRAVHQRVARLRKTRRSLLDLHETATGMLHLCLMTERLRSPPLLETLRRTAAEIAEALDRLEAIKTKRDTGLAEPKERRTVS